MCLVKLPKLLLQLHCLLSRCNPSSFSLQPSHIRLLWVPLPKCSSRNLLIISNRRPKPCPSPCLLKFNSTPSTKVECLLEVLLLSLVHLLQVTHLKAHLLLSSRDQEVHLPLDGALEALPLQAGCHLNSAKVALLQACLLPAGEVLRQLNNQLLKMQALVVVLLLVASTFLLVKHLFSIQL